MGRVWVGILLCSGVIGAMIGMIVVRGDATAQAYAPSSPAQGGLIAFSSTVEGQYEQITVLDPARQVMGVYRVDPSGKIRLCSVRSLYWDLQMAHFNGEQPLPFEIQEMQSRGSAGDY